MIECCQQQKFIKFTTTTKKFEGQKPSRKKSKSAQKLRRSIAFSSGKKSNTSGSHNGSNQKPRRERAISGVDSQCQLSTDGDFSEAQSPLGEQPKEALSWDNMYEHSLQKALTKCDIQKDNGKLEFLNCKKCGALYFSNNLALKHNKELFYPDESPMLILNNMFSDELNYDYKSWQLSCKSGKTAKFYMDFRDDYVSRLYALGIRFQQRAKTIHIAIELLDRYFLNPKCPTQIDAKTICIYLTTCFLIASKLDEIDDKLVFISDVQKYYRTTKFNQEMPSWTDVVETERHIMKFFDWNISFPLPIHFLEMFLAQGIIFTSDGPCNLENISMTCYKKLNDMIQARQSFKNVEGWLPSQVATLIIYQTRNEILEQPWSPELEIITKSSKADALNLVSRSKEQFIWPVFEQDELLTEILDLTEASNQRYLSGKKSEIKKQSMRPLRIKCSLAGDSNASQNQLLANHSNHQSQSIMTLNQKNHMFADRRQSKQLSNQKLDSHGWAEPLQDPSKLHALRMKPQSDHKKTTSSSLCPDITLNSARAGLGYFSRLKKPTAIQKISLGEMPRTSKNESFMEKYFQKKAHNAPKKNQSYVSYNSTKQISNMSCLWRRHPQIVKQMVPAAFNSREKPVKKDSSMLKMFYGDTGPQTESEGSLDKPKQVSSSLSISVISNEKANKPN